MTAPKPCPKCWSTLVHCLTYLPSGVDYDTEPLYRVMCTECRLLGRICDSRAAAVEAWNGREGER